jgi:serine/threonine protein kinase/Flp pilus assembly protein TadD
MNCPTCQANNPLSAVQCYQCATPFDHATRTLDIGLAWSDKSPEENASLSIGRGALQTGAVIANRYAIQEHLGIGGMGTVYKATDLELERVVALKVIRPELAGQSDVLRRFKQELILARKVTHKNVIRIFDLGEHEGVKFITMEYVEGQSLKSYIAETGKLHFRESARIIQQVCLALDAAHSEDVVHRDLKPQNIMLDRNGKAFVMDFGIARSVGREGMTQTGVLVGTPEYMSPEQVMGEHVDGRSDLFSMGVIFYQLLTGELPFKAETPTGSMIKRTRDSAVPPVQADASVPEFLSDVVSKCLAINVTKRYQTAMEVWQDLNSWMSMSSEGSVSRGLHLIPRRLRYPIGAIALIVILMVGIGIFALRHRPHEGLSTKSPIAPLAKSLAIVPFRNASGQEQLNWLGASLAEMLTSDVGQSAQLRTISGERLDQVLHDLRISPDTTLDTKTLSHLAEFSSADVVVWGQYAKFGDEIRIDATIQDLKSGRTTSLKVHAENEKQILKAIDQLANEIRQSLALSSKEINALQATAFKPSSLSLPALRDYNEGLQFERAGENLQAVKRFQAATQEDPQFALAYSKLGETFAKLREDNDAESASLKAVQLSGNLPPPEKYAISAAHSQIIRDYPKAIEAYEALAKISPSDSDVLFNLAGLYENSGALDKARTLFSKVVELDPKRVAALLGQGRVEIRSGNPQGGLEYLARALNLAIEIGNDEEKSDILQAMGVGYQNLNKLPEALRAFQDSLDIKRRLDLKSGIASSLDAIAEVQDAMGKPDSALKNYAEALRLRREIGDKAGIGDVMTDMGNVYIERGEFDQGLRFYKESLQIQIDVDNKQNQGIALNNIGNAYLAKGSYDDAQTYFQQALGLRERLGVPNAIAETLHNLGETSTNLSQFDQALSQYERALELWRNAGDERGVAIESLSMGTVFGLQGRFGAAISSQEEALKTFRRLNEQGYWLAEVLSGYGKALADLGRGDEAQKALIESLNVADALKNQALISQIQGFRGDDLFNRRNFAAASQLYGLAQKAAARSSDRRAILVSKVNLARVAVKEGRPHAALDALTSLAEEAASIGMKHLSADCSIQLGEALIEMKKYDLAEKELQQGLSKAEKLGLQVLVAQGHSLLAKAFALSGNQPEAKRHHEEATAAIGKIRAEAHSDLRGRLDLVGIDST